MRKAAAGRHCLWGKSPKGLSERTRSPGQPNPFGPVAADGRAAADAHPWTVGPQRADPNPKISQGELLECSSSGM
ncbi:MAG: hypothetical protein N2110_07255 [Flavobacteriales bacterium]|nr:hypothetical protein [Flavobacteriales bacterium]MCX7768801.1 hypothetical protein [Flavobacteriales bacterium]MDW8410670.1 hypothetical protein [Flavobacteriales bacterium]